MSYLKRAAYPVTLFVLIIVLLAAGDEQNWFYFKTMMVGVTE
jgi:hypothetical protein